MRKSGDFDESNKTYALNNFLSFLHIVSGIADIVISFLLLTGVISVKGSQVIYYTGNGQYLSPLHHFSEHHPAIQVFSRG
jgi:uncharacterized membrane protein (Fun14 family)